MRLQHSDFDFQLNALVPFAGPSLKGERVTRETIYDENLSYRLNFGIERGISTGAVQQHEQHGTKHGSDRDRVAEWQHVLAKHRLNEFRSVDK